MKDCKKIELFISMDIDNELEENEKIFLEKHIEKCNKCRDKKKKFLKLKEAFNSNLRVKRSITINSFKRIFVTGIAALILIISGIVFSIYYNNNKNISSENNSHYPLSSYFLEEENKVYTYDEPMFSYIMYSYNE